MTIEELPIYSEDCEKAILASMIVQPLETCPHVVGILKTSDFFVESHRSLFAVISSMWLGNKAIDVLTVTQKLKAVHLNSNRDAMNDVVSAMTSFGVPASITTYVKIIQSKAKDRETQRIGINLVLLAQNHEEEKQPDIDKAVKLLDELTCGTTIELISGPAPWDEFMESMSKPRDETKGRVLPTGYRKMDDAIKIRGGQVFVIAAVQKHGKSTLALNIAVRWWQQKFAGCFVSLEMDKDDLQRLIMANVTGIVRDALEERTLTPERCDILFQQVVRARDWPYSFYDKPTLRIGDFRALARERARQGDSFLIIDYFQLLQSASQSYHLKRHEELEENMRIIKTTAMETGLAIGLVSQVNTKSVEGKENNRPTVANLRGTGAIAQDADVVMILSEPNPATRINGMRQLIGDIVASRRGPEMDIPWLFDGAHARFIEG